MKTIISVLFAFLSTLFQPRVTLQLEIVALRHQLGVYRRTTLRPRIHPADRMFWSWFSRCWSGWRSALVFVQPETVIAWQRKRFRDHWAKLSKQGRPPVSKEIQVLIRKISTANPSWGAPRVVGELRKVGIDVAKSTVEKYRVWSNQAPSPTWKAFLHNHVKDLVSIDLFVMPTLRFKVLIVLVVLALTVAGLRTSIRKAYGFKTYRACEVALYDALGALPVPYTANKFS